jgi:serine/threonine protein kinase
MFDFIVAQKHVPEMQACKLFHQIVEGVDSLHHNEITHRDLKPEVLPLLLLCVFFVILILQNLLLKASPDGWIVKVVDFGLSNTHEGGKLLSTACGSPCYAAPEMIAGKKYVGPMADIWSMGVILFALVCGYLPFEDPNTALLYKKILSGDYKPPKWISPEVKDLIRCILEVDPRKRYTMDDIRRHPWYTMVPESSIPREVPNSQEDEIVRNETLKVLSNGGMDMQALLDGLASHACNALTATYYLFEHRVRAGRVSKNQHAAPSHGYPHSNSHDAAITAKEQANQAQHSNNNHAENNQAHRPKSNPHPETSQQPQQQQQQAQPPAQSHHYNLNETQIVKPSPLHQHPQPGAQQNGPLILPSTTAAIHQQQQVAAGVTAGPMAPSQSPKSPKNSIAPYLQTPQIIQQARQIQQQHQQQPGNTPGMPSLDFYMKTGFSLPIGQQQQQQQQQQQNGSIPPINNAPGVVNKMIVAKPNGAPEIPKLVLKPNNKNGVIIPPLQRPTESNNNDNNALTSQTARQPPQQAHVLQPLAAAHAAPQSARAVLESVPAGNSPHGQNALLDTPVMRPPPEFDAPEGFDLLGEGKGRPATRRSRMRSRGGEVPVEDYAEPLPAEGMLEMEELPISVLNDRALEQEQQQQAAKKPVPPAARPQLQPQPNSSSNQTDGGLSSPLERMTISHEPAAPSSSQQPAQPQQPSRQPEGTRPPGGAPSAGGRRGKNIVESNTNTNNNANNENRQQPNGPAIQPTPPSQLKPSAPAAAKQPSRPAPPASTNTAALSPVVVPAGVAQDSVSFNRDRQDAQKNKMAAQGTFKIAP